MVQHDWRVNTTYSCTGASTTTLAWSLVALRVQVMRGCTDVSHHRCAPLRNLSAQLTPSAAQQRWHTGRSSTQGGSRTPPWCTHGATMALGSTQGGSDTPTVRGRTAPPRCAHASPQPHGVGRGADRHGRIRVHRQRARKSPQYALAAVRQPRARARAQRHTRTLSVSVCPATPKSASSFSVCLDPQLPPRQHTLKTTFQAWASHTILIAPRTQYPAAPKTVQ